MRSAHAIDALESIVDLDRYPIHRLDSPDRAELVAGTRHQMHAVGCARITGFLRPEAIATMGVEAESLIDQTFWAEGSQNPYATAGDASLPADHPQNRFAARTSGFIPADLLADDSPANELLGSSVMTHFIWESLGVERPIYPYADPIARNPYAAMRPGDDFPWHFDGNEFTVSVLVRGADEGGVFEYVPDIRRPNAECYERVQHVLDGGRDGVEQLHLTPGDLQLFKGRYSMHRVTRVGGRTTRVISLPSYAHDPWRMNRPHHSINYYGRASELHYAREAVLVDGLSD